MNAITPINTTLFSTNTPKMRFNKTLKIVGTVILINIKYLKYSILSSCFIGVRYNAFGTESLLTALLQHNKSIGIAFIAGDDIHTEPCSINSCCNKVAV